MKISEKERRILRVCETQANCSATLIARQLRYREHTVRHALRSLHERGLIARRPFVDLYRLGFVDHALYLTLAGESQKQREAFLAEVQGSDSVSWVIQVGGDYQFGVAITASHSNEVAARLYEWAEKFPGLIFDKALSVRLSLTLFGKKYLSQVRSTLPVLGFGHAAPERKALDSRDALILEALERKSYQSQRELSRILQMPASTVDSRIRALEERGVIAGYVYRMSLDRVGIQSYQLLLSTRGVSVALRKTLSQFAATHPNIPHMVECLGEWDFELGVEVEHQDELVILTQDLYSRFGMHLHSMKVLPVLRQLKLMNFPFSHKRFIA